MTLDERRTELNRLYRDIARARTRMWWAGIGLVLGVCAIIAAFIAPFPLSPTLTAMSLTSTCVAGPLMARRIR